MAGAISSQLSGLQRRRSHLAQNARILLLQGFVAENLLLYSSVLRLLLPRLLRMDLTSTKNAYLLFR